jgi:putative ABC transport system substrate-binding protein
MTTTITRLTRAAAVLLLFAAWLSADAQQPRVARIGVITSGSPALVDALRQRLRELGYAEGRNVAIEVRAVAQPERFREVAAELVALGVDVIVASGTATTRATKEVTNTIPIVMVSVGSPVSAGFVKSLSRPGGNVTGQSLMGAETGLKGLDLLMEVLPRAKRVAALYSPEVTAVAAFGALGGAAKSKGVTLQPVELRRPDDLEPALTAMGQARPDALLFFGFRFEQQVQIVEIVARNRLPAVYGSREAVDAGGLMSFGPRLPDLWRGAANYVDKILKGAKPGDLPVEQPTTFELVVNLKTARALGLAIPASVLARADQVIE